MLTEQQILNIKIILSGKSKLQLANELGIVQSNFSQIEKYKSDTLKLTNYFDSINPSINKLVNEMANKFANSEINTNNVSERSNKQSGSYKNDSGFQEKYNELYERLLKSQEERIKILEEERRRFFGSDGANGN